MTEKLLVTLWEKPSFTPDKTWMIFSEKSRSINSSRYFVRELTGVSNHHRWSQIKSRTENGEWPSDIVRTKKLSEEFLHQQLTLLDKISIPLDLTVVPSGYDGAIYGLEIFSAHDPLHSMRLTWWQEGPSNWKPIVEWYNNTVAYLVKTLAT